MKFLGDKLRHLRESRNWTLDDVAEFTGLSPAALSGIETNKKQPRQATVEKLAKAFKIDVVYFYTEDSLLASDLLPDMDDSTKRFIMDSENTPYLVITERAKSEGIPPETLEKILEILILNKGR